jgi:hypothetical protein
MSDENIRIRIENEIFGRMEKKDSEEEQANHPMSLLMDGDTEQILIPHAEAMIYDSIRKSGNAFPFYRD